MNTSIMLGRVATEIKMDSAEFGRFGFIVDAGYKNPQTNEDVNYFFNVTFGKNAAEFISKYVDRGMQLLLTTTPKSRTYVDQQTGKNVSAISFHIDRVEFGESKTDTTNRRAKTGTQPLGGLPMQRGQIPVAPVAPVQQVVPVEQLPFQ